MSTEKSVEKKQGTPIIAPNGDVLEVGGMGKYRLCKKSVYYTNCWYDFLKLWERSSDVATLLGLLHKGFDVPMGKNSTPPDTQVYDEIDRIVFYLMVADGWRHRPLLVNGDTDGVSQQMPFGPNGELVDVYSYETREILAQKAFDVLILKFFKPIAEWGVYSVWITAENQDKFDPFKIYTDPRLFNTIFHFFFRKIDNFMSPYPNLDTNDPLKDRRNKILCDAICNMFHMAFSWKPGEEMDPVSVTSAELNIQSARLPLLNLMAAISRLESIGFDQLDDDIVQKLSEIALTKRDTTGKIVMSIDEALAFGSHAAVIVKRYDTFKSWLEKSRTSTRI